MIATPKIAATEAGALLVYPAPVPVAEAAASAREEEAAAREELTEADAAD